MQKKPLPFKNNPQYNPSIKDSWVNVKMSGPKNNRHEGKNSTRTILLIINTILCALAIAQYYPSTISTLQQHIFSSYHNKLTRKKGNDIQRKYYFKM